MRLFLAVDIDDDVRARVARAIAVLRPALERESGARIGWVAPERLHLTLEFLGEVPDPMGDEIVRRLEPPIAQAPFVLRFGRLGLFPASGRPRVIWFGLDEGGDALRRLRTEAVARLEGISYRREARPFSPHLTIARVREPGRVAGGRRLADGEVPAAGSCTVDRLTLYRSRLSPKGPTYTAMLHVPLGTP